MRKLTAATIAVTAVISAGRTMVTRLDRSSSDHAHATEAGR
jgi:hypothetical protein